MLDDSDKATLLKLARTTLEAHFADESAPTCPASNKTLFEQQGAFVSLHRGEELRGCIGQIYPDSALCKVVQHCVLSAALEDMRFEPVGRDELEGLSIEISVLSPLRRVQNIEEIEVGRHGLYLVQGHFRGLLLPQVATQYRWNRKRFLEQTCLKAGLGASAWKDPQTIIHTFEADVFSDTPDPARQ
jgi:AmmeMemoRadiSam system protein A